MGIGNEMTGTVYANVLWSLALLLLIMSLGSLASAGYEQIYLLQSPNNMDWSNVLDVYIITSGLNAGNYEVATVAGMFQSLFALILTVVGNAIVRKVSDNSLW